MEIYPNSLTRATDKVALVITLDNNNDVLSFLIDQF